MSPRVSSTRPSADGCTLGVSTTAPPPGLCMAMSWPGGVGSGAAAALGARTAAVTAVAAPIRAPAPSPRAVRGRRRHTAAAATAPTAAIAAPTRTAHTHPGVGGGAGMVTGMRATSGLATSTTSHAPGRSICKRAGRRRPRPRAGGQRDLAGGGARARGDRPEQQWTVEGAALRDHPDRHRPGALRREVQRDRELVEPQGLGHAHDVGRRTAVRGRRSRTEDEQAERGDDAEERRGRARPHCRLPGTRVPRCQ